MAPQAPDEATDVPDGVRIIEDQEDLIRQDPLIRLFGTHAKTRILMTLLQAPDPLNPSRICEVANIHSDTWYEHRDDLLGTGIIVQSGMAGNSPLYKLVEADEDKRAGWLSKLSDWTAAYVRDETRVTDEE